MRVRHSLILLFCAAALQAESAAASWAGAAQCATCHRKQSLTLAADAHAGALFKAAAHPLAEVFASRSPARRGAYTYLFNLKPDFQVTVSDAKDIMILPVEWAFGAGRQAVTFVTQVNSEFYLEHAASYYSSIQQYAVTPGQDAVKPSSMQQAAGVLYKIADQANGIASCFECHSTGPVSFDNNGSPHMTELGVRCESCHGPLADHARNPASARARSLHRLSAVEISQLCGRCHRPPASADEKIDWNYSWNVRHQPVYLNESRCFKNSGGRLSCITCHDPHDSGESGRTLASSNRVCGTCHSGKIHPAINSENCVNCHMPLVSPQPALRFTNHWIGTYREGAKLRPLR